MDLAALIPQFGNFAWTVAAFIAALSIIVAIHELGHYLVGRWTGIKAEVFSLGIGPVLFSRMDRHGTRWQVAALPLGGYVKFLGDANAASGRDEGVLAALDKDELRQTVHGAPLWARAATVAAGPVFNFVLSFVIFAGVLLAEGVARMPMTIADLRPVPAAAGAQPLEPGDVILAVEGTPVPEEGSWDGFYAGLPPASNLTYTIRRDGQEMELTGPHIFPPLVERVAPDSAAEEAGLEAGDVILSIDGTEIQTFGQLREVAGNSNGEMLGLKVWREGEVLDFQLLPKRMDLPLEGGRFETRWMIGVVSAPLFTPETETPGLGRALSYGVSQTWYIMVSSVSGMWHMVQGRIDACNLRGPIGIAQTSGDAARQGLSSFIWFVAVLSAAVGLLNLFPVPILDGGHLVFHAWEAVTGRAPGDRALRVLMSIGLVLLIGLMAFALTNDLRC